SMIDEQILALPVQTLAAERGHLYCWTTDSHLELALQCVRHWGYEFKRTIVWVKIQRPELRMNRAMGLLDRLMLDPSNGDLREALADALAELSTPKVRIGGGHYVRSAHELCLFAVRGGLTGLVRDVPSVLFVPRTEHSAKPEELQNLAERLSPGPRIEIFARRQRREWLCWGNECPAEPVKETV
ncbi:MAG: hypothetical protein EPN91_05165, partial [Salinibacterium sp.]